MLRSYVGYTRARLWRSDLVTWWGLSNGGVECRNLYDPWTEALAAAAAVCRSFGGCRCLILLCREPVGESFTELNPSKLVMLLDTEMEVCVGQAAIRLIPPYYGCFVALGISTATTTLPWWCKTGTCIQFCLFTAPELLHTAPAMWLCCVWCCALRIWPPLHPALLLVCWLQSPVPPELVDCIDRVVGSQWHSKPHQRMTGFDGGRAVCQWAWWHLLCQQCWLHRHGG